MLRRARANLTLIEREAPAPAPERSGERVNLRRWLRMSETVFVALMLLIAALLRLVLAASGWPYSNSDEATAGLMVDDILWHGAHPAFTYGEHHVGALDAYLQVPAFLLLGPTNFALHVTTTVQMLLFLLVFYGLTRTLYSPLVARVTLALLALGPFQELLYGLRAGHYAQDMLLLSALLLWLVVLRLCHTGRTWAPWALDLGIGLVAGVALWSTVLLLPFVLAALLALSVEVGYRWRAGSPRRRWLAEALVLLSALVIGLLPFLITTIATKGSIIVEARLATGETAGSAVPEGLLERLFSLGQQIAGTMLVGLPQMLGRQTVCAGCPYWPYPGTTLAPAEALRVALISAPFSALPLLCWLLAAWSLARRACSALLRAWRGQGERSYFGNARGRAIACGRAMIVMGLGLTVLQYVLTRSSYETSDTSIRYISNIYLCMPLVVDPLCRAAQPSWRWLRARARRAPVPTRPRAAAFLATALLLVLFAIHLSGAVQALAETSNTAQFGVPTGQRDRKVIGFLVTHHATRFYTTWWVCYRLMFASQEQLDCYIVSDTSAFAPGSVNRVPTYAALVKAAPHPAYVFDLTTAEVDRSVPRQLAGRIASGDPRFSGYTSAVVEGYLIFYYAGPA